MFPSIMLNNGNRIIADNPLHRHEYDNSFHYAATQSFNAVNDVTASTEKVTTPTGIFGKLVKMWIPNFGYKAKRRRPK